MAVQIIARRVSCGDAFVIACSYFMHSNHSSNSFCTKPSPLLKGRSRGVTAYVSFGIADIIFVAFTAAERGRTCATAERMA